MILIVKFVVLDCTIHGAIYFEYVYAVTREKLKGNDNRSAIKKKKIFFVTVGC